MPPEEELIDESNSKNTTRISSASSTTQKAKDDENISCKSKENSLEPSDVASFPKIDGFILENIDNTMISSMDEDSYQHMLDVFPLDSKELKHVLPGYNKFATKDPEKMSSIKISSTLTSSSSLSSFVSIFNSESTLLKKEEDLKDNAKEEEMTNAHNNDDDEFLQRLVYVQEEFVPETQLFLQQAKSNVFLIGSGHDHSPMYRYLETLVILLGRRGSHNLQTIIFQVAAAATGSCSSNSTGVPTFHVNSPSIADPDALIDLVYRLILASSYLKIQQPTIRRHHPRSWVNSLHQWCQKYQQQYVTLAIWNDWVQSVVPQIDKTLSTFCHLALFGPNHPFRITNLPLMLPRLSDPTTCAFWTFPYQSVPASLGILSPYLGGPWVQLYTSDSDGCSFRAMQEALLAYHGTTVILIQTTAGDTFGYYTNCPWKESKRWFGQGEATESFLFGIKPTLQYYGTVTDNDTGIGGSKPYYMFLHNPVYAHVTDLNGLAIGGINDMTPRIHITTNFEHCKAGSMDGVYASGALLSDGELYFDIDVVEVFAVNFTAQEFDKAFQKGKANVAVREGTRIKAAHVDRKQFLEDFQTGQYMNKGFAHRNQVRGRHSFVAHEDGSSGYFVESKSPSVRRLFVDDDDK